MNRNYKLSKTCQEALNSEIKSLEKQLKVLKKQQTQLQKDDLLTAIATAAEQLRSGAKPKAIAADLERLVMELQKGE